MILAVAGVATGGRLTRAVTRQVGTEPGTARDLARSVASGNLTVHIDVQAVCRTSLMASMKAMRDSLTRVVSDVRENAELVAGSVEPYGGAGGVFGRNGVEHGRTHSYRSS